MQDKLRKKLAKRYSKGGSGNTKKHPDAPRPWPPHWNKSRKKSTSLHGNAKNTALYGTRLRCPRTEQEVHDAWIGLCRMMDYFGGDRKLAARTLQVKINKINTCIQRGWVDQFTALRCEETCDNIEWTAGGIAAHLYWESEWNRWRKLYNDPNKKGIKSLKHVPDSGYS